MRTKSHTKVRVSAIVTHADGSKEDLGVIAETKPLNFIQRLFIRIKKLFKKG